MKKTILSLFLLVFVGFMAQQVISKESTKKVPSVKVKNLRGKVVNTSSFENDGKPFVINFWATWCKPCIMELNTISDVYEDWQDETGVKIFAISIDDSRNSRKVAPFVNGRGWTYDVYLDENSDFRRALGINNPPHTILCDGKGNIVWEHNGYAPGDEEELYEKIVELTKK